MRALRARRRGEDAALTEAPSVRGRRPLAPLVRLVDGCESGAREGGEAEVVAEACVKQVPSRFREGSGGGAAGEAAARSRYRRHVTSRRRGRGRAGLQEGSEKVRGWRWALGEGTRSRGGRRRACGRRGGRWCARTCSESAQGMDGCVARPGVHGGGRSVNVRKLCTGRTLRGDSRRRWTRTGRRAARWRGPATALGARLREKEGSEKLHGRVANCRRFRAAEAAGVARRGGGGGTLGCAAAREGGRGSG